MNTKRLPWFRMYTDFLNDPKMISLAFEDQRHFVGILALKSDGALESQVEDSLMDRIVAQRLWIDHGVIRDVKKRLVNAGLISVDWHPLAWDKRQQPSDSSYERVKRHREKRASAGLPQQNYIKAEVRDGVFQRDNYSCVYCNSVDDLTIDHDVPQSLGGGDEVSNLLTACRSCNASKRDLTAIEFRERNMKRFSNGVDIDKERDIDKELDKKKTKQLPPPEGVSSSVWSDFLQHRKTKKASVTQTAIDGIAREAVKAGVTLNDALAMCCERGWVGFNAEWLAEKQGARSINPATKASPGKHTGFQNLDYKTGINEDGTFA